MYNNPFFYGNPGMFARRGLFQSLKGINWGNLLSNTQKTLGVINQAIPIVYQVKPMMQNAKTIFKIADTMRKPDTPVQNNVIKKETEATPVSNNKPTFFLWFFSIISFYKRFSIL